MTVGQDPQPRHEGAVGALADLGARVVTALPPAFLLLVLINVAFLGVVMWFLDDQIAQRTHMAEKLFDRCMDIALQATPPH
jgi:hypothetical protein